MSPAAVQQQAIQEEAPAQADTVVDTIQADAATPEVYEDEQQFGENNLGEGESYFPFNLPVEAPGKNKSSTNLFGN